MIKNMPLFPLTSNVNRIVLEDTCVVPEAPDIIDLTFDENITEAILPRQAVERAHLDVYDASATTDEPPFRLTARTHMLDSDRYHESVYLNIKGAYRGTLDLSRCDYQTLYEVRKDNSWKGVDSLYHAWLLVNHRLTPPGFKMRKFAQSYPDWRKVIMPTMDLTRVEEEVDGDDDGETESKNQPDADGDEEQKSDGGGMDDSRRSPKRVLDDDVYVSPAKRFADDNGRGEPSTRYPTNQTADLVVLGGETESKNQPDADDDKEHKSDAGDMEDSRGSPKRVRFEDDNERGQPSNRYPTNLTVDLAVLGGETESKNQPDADSSVDVIVNEIIQELISKVVLRVL